MGRNNIMIKFSNAQELAKNSDTFESPCQYDLDAISIGDYVKVCVSPERFWVKVTDRQGYILIGEINNDLICSDEHELFCGMTIEFTTDNVYQTE